jgi:phosphoglycerate dehydrogenase-like enzyme
MAFIFALAKNLRRLDIRTREGRWRENLVCDSVCVEGRTLGSVGVGSIAGETFRIARGIGFGRLLGYDPYADPKRAAELGVELVDLDTVMRESDFVAVNTFLSAETRGLVGARELALMKPTAYLINTSRGPVIDEKALVEVLQQRRIAGAGLDVFEEEPPPKDHPLFALDNVILAPHSVAWTMESLRDNSLEACRNVRDVYEGKVPPHLANPKVAGRPGLQAKLAARRKS